MTVAAKTTTPQRARKPADSPATDQARPTAPAVDERLVKDLAEAFRLFSGKTRLRVLFLLMRNDELHVRALCSHLGQSQPAVSHHLAMLREAGLIEARRDGKHSFYRIVPDAFGRLLDRFFDAIPDRDERLEFFGYELNYRPPVRPK